MITKLPNATCLLLAAVCSHSVVAQEQVAPAEEHFEIPLQVSPEETETPIDLAIEETGEDILLVKKLPSDSDTIEEKEPPLLENQPPASTTVEQTPTDSEAKKVADPSGETDSKTSVKEKKLRAEETSTARETEQENMTEPAEIAEKEAAKPTAPNTDMALAEVIALLQQQQALLASQGEQLAAQAKQIAVLSGELDALRAPPPGLSNEQEESVETEIKVEEIQVAQTTELNENGLPKSEEQRQQEQTDKDVATTQADDPTRALLNEFPGAWRLPRTQAALSIGGYVQMAAVVNHDPLAVQDRFIVGSIPVGEDTDNIEAEVNLSAARSRLNFDLREPTDFGTMRAFIEGDFDGDGDQNDDTFRLRHAFGQWNRMLAGKTWSAFVDAQATPESVNFEGLNGRINVRQGQVRFEPEFGEGFSLITSLEDPNPQVQGGEGITRIPDVILAGRFEPNERLHVKLSLLGRQIQAQYEEVENPGVEKEYGWGLSTSGRFKTPYLEQRDSVLFQLNGGNAIGRYVRDLRSVGAYDGIFDDDGDLHLFDVISGYVSYQHWWGSLTRSNFTLGFVDIDNPDFVEGDAYKRTISASANIMWTPTPRVDIGFEALWGERENEDGSTGNASQTQVMARYRFSQ